MDNETVEAYVNHAMMLFDAIEGRVEENLADCGIGWEAVMNYPMSDSARFASAAGL